MFTHLPIGNLPILLCFHRFTDVGWVLQIINLYATGDLPIHIIL